MESEYAAKKQLMKGTIRSLEEKILQTEKRSKGETPIIARFLYYQDRETVFRASKKTRSREKGTFRFTSGNEGR